MSGVPPCHDEAVTTVPVGTALARGYEALAVGNWSEARAAFEEAVSTTESPEALGRARPFAVVASGGPRGRCLSGACVLRVQARGRAWPRGPDRAVARASTDWCSGTTLRLVAGWREPTLAEGCRPRRRTGLDRPRPVGRFARVVRGGEVCGGCARLGACGRRSDSSFVPSLSWDFAGLRRTSR